MFSITDIEARETKLKTSEPSSLYNQAIWNVE